jgi:acetoin utilization deacetylase AcuC-like enzyme
MHVVYSARYHIDIGPHVFSTQKYGLVHDRLRDSAVIRPVDIVEPRSAAWDELALAHTAEYLANMRDGTLSREDLAQLELPWSAEMVDGFRLMTGGTIDAACLACGVPRAPAGTHGLGGPTGGAGGPATPLTGDASAASAFEVVCHIGGGLHHAFANHGEGFCPFNDVAVAVRVLQSRGIERAAVVDLDVHHGNGTAFIFESDPRVFTFSMHQQHNYPMWKPRGSLDIGLPDGAGDRRVLSELAQALPMVMASEPQCVFYLAGADPYEDDQLGGLRMTREGLRQRDRLVIDTVCAAGVPLVIALAGGYARLVEDTVAIHAATIDEAQKAATKT